MNEPTGLQQLLKRHGARVRRKVAMEMLGVSCQKTFYKIVAGIPRIKHRLPGEGQDKYLVAVIFEINPKSAGVEVSVGAGAVTERGGGKRAINQLQQ